LGADVHAEDTGGFDAMWTAVYNEEEVATYLMAEAAWAWERVTDMWEYEVIDGAAEHGMPWLMEAAVRRMVAEGVTVEELREHQTFAACWDGMCCRGVYVY
jgi:hypothetical protein